MELTAMQKDVIAEVSNIGFNRAAGALSMLLAKRVRLQSPALSFYRMDELERLLLPGMEKEVTTVHQIFSGAISGNALLLLGGDSASVLVDLLTGGSGKAHRMNVSDREALVEVGNILLNAYLGTFGNMLKVQISFTVPHLRVDDINQIFNSLVVGEITVHYVLVISTEFAMENGSVSGKIILMMGIESLEALLAAIDKMNLNA